MTKREEYIKWLTKAKENEYGEIILSGQAVKDIVGLLKEPHWIPCSERLPKGKGLYLVTVKNDHQRMYSKTCWYYGNDKWFARQDVIAWQPLPEPWRGEEE